MDLPRVASLTAHFHVTGGTGFVGSHTVVELLQAGQDVIIVDDLSNSSAKVIDRIRTIVGLPENSARLCFYKLDLLDADELDKIFISHPNIKSVIHFAGLKAVGESVREPLRYYEVNLRASLNLLNAMDRHNVTRLIFSSTAALYGEPAHSPITEETPLDPRSPYASTKIMIETFMRDLYRVDAQRWHFGILRYFNPCGAHESGLLGEDPNGVPQNLMPFIAKVAGGKLPSLTIFGDDYETRDGTAIRDYIHVVDLAKGHISALAKLEEKPQCFLYNLGSGAGTTVKEMVEAFERACGHELPKKLGKRREGDVPILVADPTAAARDLGWHVTLDVDRMCADLWRWQQKNPDGYNTQHNDLET